MAPLSLEVDMKSFEKIDLQVSYWKLFSLIKDDFVTKNDLQIILAAATAPPPSFKVVAVPTFLMGEALNAGYQGALAVGAAVREGAISGLENTLK